MQINWNRESCHMIDWSCRVLENGIANNRKQPSIVWKTQSLLRKSSKCSLIPKTTKIPQSFLQWIFLFYSRSVWHKQVYKQGKYEWNFSEWTNNWSVRRVFDCVKLMYVGSSMKLFVIITNDSYRIASWNIQGKRVFVLKRNCST